MEVSRVAMNPWDFTLYQTGNGAFILKVIFSEGEYKSDIGRYFALDKLTIDSTNIDDLKLLASQIRSDYPNVPLQQIEKSAITILK